MHDRQHHPRPEASDLALGASRALRVGPFIYVSATAGLGPDGRLVPGGAEPQTRQALRQVESALKALGAGLGHVVRTRLYVVEAAEAELIARIHAETFAAIKPASSLVQVLRLGSEETRVMIEAEAILTAVPPEREPATSRWAQPRPTASWPR